MNILSDLGGCHYIFFVFLFYCFIPVSFQFFRKNPNFVVKIGIVYGDSEHSARPYGAPFCWQA